MGSTALEHHINGNELPMIVQEKHQGKLVQHENTRQNNSPMQWESWEAPLTVNRSWDLRIPTKEHRTMDPFGLCQVCGLLPSVRREPS